MQIGNYTVLTSLVNPPIPTRSFDWAAWCDGREDWLVGSGATELEAINSLREQMEGAGAV